MAILRTAPRGSGTTLLDTRGWLRSVWQPGPERWVWPVSLIAWIVLAWGTVGWYPLGDRLGPLGSHQHLPSSPSGGGGAGSPVAQPGFAEAAATHLILWVVMVAATMLPLIARNLRTVGMRSPRPRRTIATLEVTSGWSAVWVAAGVVVAVALAMSSAVIAWWQVTAVVTVVAVAWQFTRMRATALTRCHQTIAPPLGTGATAACVRFGSSLGGACLLGCWPSMVLMAVAGHNLAIVGVLAWLSWRDVRLPHNRPARWSSAAVLAAVGALVVLVQA